MQEEDEMRKKRLEVMLETQKEAVVAAALAGEITMSTYLMQCRMLCLNHCSTLSLTHCSMLCLILCAMLCLIPSFAG